VHRSSTHKPRLPCVSTLVAIKIGTKTGTKIGTKIHSTTARSTNFIAGSTVFQDDNVGVHMVSLSHPVQESACTIKNQAQSTAVQPA
jgi:hypothetical protein